MKSAALCGQVRGMSGAIETEKLSGSQGCVVGKGSPSTHDVYTLSSPVATKGQPRWTVVSCHVGQLASGNEGGC